MDLFGLINCELMPSWLLFQLTVVSCSCDVLTNIAGAGSIAWEAGGAKKKASGSDKRIYTDFFAIAPLVKWPQQPPPWMKC